MVRKSPTPKKSTPKKLVNTRTGRPSSPLDTRIIHCGDCLDQLQKLPDRCVDLIYIDPPFNSNRNYEVFWGETKEKRAFKDRHASTQADIDQIRPRFQQLARVIKPSGSFCSQSEWHAKPPKRARSCSTGIRLKAVGHPWHVIRPPASHRSHLLQHNETPCGTLLTGQP